MASRRVGDGELELELPPRVPPLLLGIEIKGCFCRLLFSVDLLVSSSQLLSGLAKGIREGEHGWRIFFPLSAVHPPLGIDNAGDLG